MLVDFLSMDICFLKSNIFLQNKKDPPYCHKGVVLSQTGRGRRLMGGATVTVEQVPDQLAAGFPSAQPARGDWNQHFFFLPSFFIFKYFLDKPVETFNGSFGFNV